MAPPPVRGCSDPALARGRVARVRVARDQRFLLLADRARDLRALAERDAAEVSLRAEGPSLRHALQAAPRLPRLDRAPARSGAPAGRQARRRRVAATVDVRVRPRAARRLPARAPVVAHAARARAPASLVVHRRGRRSPARRERRRVPVGRAGLPDVARGDRGLRLRPPARAYPEVRIGILRSVARALGRGRARVAGRRARRVRLLRQRRRGARGRERPRLRRAVWRRCCSRGSP